MDSSADPQHVFSVAVDRGTYIFLGVICEMVAGVIFVADVRERTRDTLRRRLIDGVTIVSEPVAQILRGISPPDDDVRRVFSTALTVNDQIEFVAVEIGRRHPQIVAAYETLGLVSRVMSRALGLRGRLEAARDRTVLANDVLEAVAALLDGLSTPLTAGEDQDVRDRLSALERFCNDSIAETLARERAAVQEAGRRAAISDRVALQGAVNLLGEYRALVAALALAPEILRRPGRYRLRRLPNWPAAYHNGIRSVAAVLIAALVWDVTAWPSGASAVSLVAVICGRFAAVENNVLASSRFFYGACAAVVASLIPVTLLVPVASGFGALAVVIIPFMFVGGLAARHPPLAGMAASYNMFFLLMLGLANDARFNEQAWLTTAIALLLSLGSGMLVFRTVLPFDEYRVCAVMRHRAMQGLSRILCDPPRLDEARWVGMITQSMQRVIQYSGLRGAPVIDASLHGALAVMTIGRNILAVHGRRERLPPDAAQAVAGLFARRGALGEGCRVLAADVAAALETLGRIEAALEPEHERLVVTATIGALLVVQTELSHNRMFLHDRQFAEALSRRALPERVRNACGSEA